MERFFRAGGGISAQGHRVGERSDDLFALPALYRTAREALSLMTDERFHGGRVYTVAQLRAPLLLKNLEGQEDLIAQEVRTLAAHDREKGTQYCETLYYYLICCRSLQKDLRSAFYPSKHRALPHPKNAGGILPSRWTSRSSTQTCC